MVNGSVRYDDEFKTHAVKMVVEQDRTISAVASDLGVSQPTIRRWVRQATKPESSKDKRIAELEAENKKLKKQLANTKETVDVLKKSVAIFIKP
ncbi:transposase [uncultured Anaerococcus sp.]|jgi:transposase|uniref:transposase n=1 Tax=uncultured Anaerococcus sp. TaxID=293428 RepID=UPI0026058A24|nr:transposase [uncultured Anaerococcus sp.]